MLALEVFLEMDEEISNIDSRGNEPVQFVRRGVPLYNGLPGREVIFKLSRGEIVGSSEGNLEWASVMLSRRNRLD